MPVKMIQYLCGQNKRHVVLDIHSLLWSTRSRLCGRKPEASEPTCTEHLKREDLRRDLGEMRHEYVTLSDMVQYGFQWRLMLTANIVEASVCMFVIDTIRSITIHFSLLHYILTGARIIEV